VPSSGEELKPRFMDNYHIKKMVGRRSPTGPVGSSATHATHLLFCTTFCMLKAGVMRLSLLKFVPCALVYTLITIMYAEISYFLDGLFFGWLIVGEGADNPNNF
jgi:hypothetical protein